MGRLSRPLGRWLRRGPERAPDHAEPPPGWEVLPGDWVAAGNGLRRTLGLEPYSGVARYPTVPEMEAWERAYPGTAAQWRRLARLESEIRYLREGGERGVDNGVP